MFNIERAALRSESDGLELPLIAVFPDADIRGILQIAHGMCEHKERYLPFMEFLAENGYASVIHDHRGHGEGALQRGELGYFGRGGAQALIADVHQVSRWAKSRFPGAPLYLFGHSMGSLAARAYLKRHESEISGLMLSGSPSYNPGAPVAKLLADAIARLRGDRTRSKFLKMLTFGPFYRAFPGEGGKCAWISSDPEVVRAYEESPLCGFTFTSSGFSALYALMKLAYDARGRAGNPDLPVLFFSGADDPCRGGDAGFARAISNMSTRGYRRVGHRLYPGMRHEVLQEPGRADVYRDVVEALRAWEAGA